MRFNKIEFTPLRENIYTLIGSNNIDPDDYINLSFENLKVNGLKNIIKTPHNLYGIVDENGEMIKMIIELVYTPFSKSDINIILLGNVLTVKIGKENLKNELSNFEIYHGISNQNKIFSLNLDNMVELSKIKAEANDGILKIEIPFKEIKFYNPNEPINIKIN